MKPEMNIPIYAKKILTHLESAGFEAFVVGGCVRDTLRGISPSDWDICTVATPMQTSSVFENIMPVIPTGVKHGTVTVLSDGFPIEVTTYRTDGDYMDSRHPEKVEFINSIEADLARRDFTVNAIAYNPNHGLIDPFMGAEDIKNGIIRCVGNPQKRFEEDALRILRALRFSATCEFDIEKETETAIFSCKNLLKNISAERILSEFKKLILADKPLDILIKFRDVINVCIPHKTDDRYLEMINSLPKNISLRMASFLGGEAWPEVSKILHSLKSDNELRRSVCTITENSEIEPPITKSQIKHMLRLYGIQDVYNILTFRYAKEKFFKNNASAFDYSLTLLDEIIENHECFSLDNLSLRGSDIIALGVPAGPRIGDILNSLLTSVINEELDNTRPALIDYAKKII